MGEQPLSVAFDEFKIGFCKVTGYTVQYKTTGGVALLPASIAFDQNGRKFTISGAVNDFDVIPCGSDFIDIVVQVTGEASPSLNTTMQFIVTLQSNKESNATNPNCQITQIAKSLQSKPYFEALGSETTVKPLNIYCTANETLPEFNLGKLIYEGDPAD